MDCITQLTSTSYKMGLQAVDKIVESSCLGPTNNGTIRTDHV